jgi:hypothetical protein
MTLEQKQEVIQRAEATVFALLAKYIDLNSSP